MSSEYVEKPRTIIPGLNINPPNTPPDIYPSNLAYFNSIPWTANLLSQPNTIPLVIQARNPLSKSFDQLYANTLNHQERVSHMLSFFNAPKRVIEDPATPITQISTLYYVGHALTGGPGMLHGGITMTLVDEAMGAITEVNNVLGKTGEGFSGMTCVTGELKIRFIKPVLTGDVVRVLSSLIKAEGRKTWIKCTVEDGEGQELASAESIWIAPRGNVGREML